MGVSKCTIGDLRRSEIFNLDIWCVGIGCHHYGSMSTKPYADEVLISEIAERLRCPACERRGVVDVRPSIADHYAACWKNGHGGRPP